MPENVQDIVVSDGYGRSKRASLLYGAGLVVLAIATPSGSGVSILGAVVPLAGAKVLTWLAATYFTINFYLEWEVAKITNSKAMANENGGGVNARLKELTERFQRYSDRITEVSDAYVAALTGVTGNIDRFVDEVLTQDQAMKSRSIPTLEAKGSEEFVLEASGWNDQMRNDHFSKLNEESANRLSSFKMMIQNDIAIVENHANSNLTVYDAVKENLGKLTTDLNTLAGRFNIQQRVMFYVLDFGVVLVMYVTGTAIAVVAAVGIVHACRLP